MKLKKRVFTQAAKVLANCEESNDGRRFACNALGYVTTGDPYHRNIYAEKFVDLFKDKYRSNSDRFGLYGYPTREKDLARSLALLLAAEVLGGTDGNVF